MKTNKFIIILVILAIIIISICALFVRKDEYARDNGNAKLIAINTYFNYAYGSEFYGTAIFDNGDIYIWKENNNSNKNFCYR